MSQTLATRPLGAFSNFVVERMPAILEDRAQAAARLAIAVEEFLPSAEVLAVILADPYRCDLAHLDLTMAEAAIVHSGGVVPTELTRVVDFCAELSGQLPMLTYEGLVMINPPDDPRTFTRGAVGEAERHFYFVHMVIESCLAVIAQACSDGRDASAEMAEVLRLTEELRSGMNPAHFAAFRLFLMSHPGRNLKGPSGAFTGRIPLLELRLWSAWLADEHRASIARIMSYMPRADRPLVREALESPCAVTRAKRPHDFAPFVPFGEFLLQFRRLHLASVTRQVPEAIRDKVPGTGGAPNPGTFLRELIRITQDLLARLKKAAS